MLSSELRMVVAVGVVTLGAVGGAAGETAFRLADAALVWNARTGKTKEGRAWVKWACGDFVGAVERLTGRKPAVYEEGAEPADLKSVVYLGETDAARRAGFDPKAFRTRDWRVKVEKSRAYVFGTTGMSASYAMTTFLEEFCGYRFLVPEGNDPVDFNPDAVVPKGEKTVRPPIYRVDIYTAMNGWDGFERRRRSVYTDELEGEYNVSWATREADGKPRQCHTTFCYLRPPTDFKEHPEWFSLRDGVRQPMQLCYSTCLRDPLARAKILERLECFIREDRANHPQNWPCVYDFSQQDSNAADPLCECADCKATAAKYDRRGGHASGGSAGLLLELVNALADDVAKRHPDVKLRTFAYCATEALPKPGTFRIADNVIIWWCDLFTRSDHLQPLTKGPFNRSQAQRVDDWLQVAPTVSVWDYMLYRDAKCCPEWAIDAISADLRYYRDRGVQRLFLESERMDPLPQAFYDLNYYLYTVAAYDPDVDLDAETRRYCRVYGKGAAKMLEALSLLRRLTRELPVKDCDAFLRRDYPWRTRENWKTLRDLIRAAYDSEAEGPCRARIALPLARVEYELARLSARKASALGDLHGELERFGAHAQEYVRGQMDARRRPAALKEVSDMKSLFGLGFSWLPEELKGVPAEKMKSVDHHRIAGGDNGQTLDDPDSETGKGRVWKYGKPDASHRGFPIQCGIWDGCAKKGVTRTIAASDADFSDEKYHWIRIGRVRLTRRSTFWMPGDWHLNADLSDLVMESEDGRPDSNWYDAFVSVKVTGNAYVKGSTKKNGIWVDRLVFSRTSPPDDTAAVLAQVEKLRDGETLTLEPREYWFSPGQARKVFLAPSNNQTGEKRVVFPIFGKRNVTIDGNGATLVFDCAVFPFAVQRSQGVRIRNLTVTKPHPVIAAFTVKESRDTGVVLAFDGDTDYDVTDGELTFHVEGREVTTRTGRLSLHEIGNHNVHYFLTPCGEKADPDRDGFASSYSPVVVERLAPGEVFVRYRNVDAGRRLCKPVPYPVGCAVGVNLYARDSVAVFLEDASGCSVENVSIRRFGGMGLVAQRSQDLTIDGLRVFPAEGDRTSTAADMMQIIACCGQVTIQNCEGSYTMDDIIDIHGNYMAVDSWDGTNLVVRNFRDWGKPTTDDHYGFFPLRTGDELSFIAEPDRRELGRAKIKSLASVPGDLSHVTVSLDAGRPAPKGLEPGVLIENLTLYPNVTFRNNSFHHYPHLRFSGRGRYLIENNRLENARMAFLILDLKDYWYESGPVEDMTIRNNTLIGCNALGGRTFVWIDSQGWAPGTVVHRRILLEGNRYEGIKQRGVVVGSTAKCIVRDPVSVER